MSAPTVTAPEFLTTTEAILREISTQRKYQRTVAQLCGIGMGRWEGCVKRDDWTTGEVAKIARVLKVEFEWLLGGVR